MRRDELTLRLLVGATVLTLVGCSGEPDSDATPQPTASTVVEGRSVEQRPGQENAAETDGTTSSASGSQTAETSGASDSRTINGVVTKIADKALEEQNPVTLMNIEPGTDRLFQNTPNEAELANAKARRREKLKARQRNAELRKHGLENGLGAPVYDVGGGELKEVNGR